MPYPTLAGKPRAATRKLDIALIGAPVDLGQNKPGVDMGPAALRFPDLDRNLVKSLRSLGHTVEDLLDVDVAHRARLPIPDPGDKSKYLTNIVDASTNLARMVHHAAAQRNFPLVMRGHHSTA